MEKKYKSELNCPICDIFIYDGDKNHINCIIPYNKKMLKNKINSYYILDKHHYEEIYDKILPPIYKGWPGFKVINTNIIYPDILVYDIYWRQLWYEEFKTTLIFPKWDLLIKLKNIINNDKIVQINSNPCMYGWLLSKIGCEIYTTNKDIIFDCYSMMEFIDVNETFKKYENCNTLLIELNDVELNQDLDNFNGNKIIIIGQNRYFGKFKLKGKDRYFYDEKWLLLDTFYIDSWFGIDDQINIYERNNDYT